ncbi:MAG: flavocytochrome c [Alkalispirochaeta sp.]
MKRILIALLVAVAAIGLLGSCGSKETTDIVIIGGGGAGLSAAVEAVDNGAKVILVEKMPVVGGNTNYATGGINAAGTRFQKELGIEDSPELFYKDTMKGGQELNDPDLVRVMTGEAAASVEWLASLGADLSDVGRLGGHSVNRSHRPTGGAAVGGHIVQTLEAAARDRGVDIRTWTSAIAILGKDGKVTGVRVQDLQNDKEYEISAKAVIITTGGFGANPELIASLDPSLKGFGTTNHKGATGDAFDLVESYNVALVDMKQIQTHPTVVPNNGTMITEAVRGNGAILVSRGGERFINELDTRDVVSEATLQQANGTAMLVFDQEIRESLSAIESYVKSGLVTEADSLESLAEAIGAPSDALAATVAEYNGFVVANNDSDYNRKSMARTLDNAPFYAVEVGPAVHHTMGGIKINTEARVINADGGFVESLYAAGECTGGVHGANRLGGNALADIVTFGRIAGRNAALSTR